MKATAISNNIRNLCLNRVTGEAKRELNPSEHSLNNKCPAIMLALSRTDKVRGRINKLIVSTKTIKGAKITGAPLGTNMIITLEVLCINPYSINLNQIARAKDLLRDKCLVTVKMYGSKPIKLNTRRLKNNNKIADNKGIGLEFINRRSSSSSSRVKILPGPLNKEGLIIHVEGVNNTKGKREIYKGDLRETLGSNTENRLVTKVD